MTTSLGRLGDNAIAVSPSVTVATEPMTRLSLLSFCLTVTGCCGVNTSPSSRDDEDMTQDCFNLLPQSAGTLQQSNFFDCSDHNTESDIARFTLTHKIILI